jgi:uncharacterized protein involved in exopolysaccharide biosynthesis
MNARDDEINLMYYWNVLWRHKRLIIGLCAVSVALAAGVSLLLPKYYRAETVLIATGSEAGGLGAALSSIPLAGVLSVGAGIQTSTDKVLVVLNSRTIAEQVITRFDLLRVFNEDDWDRQKGAWKDPADPPLLQDAVKRLTEDVVDISTSKEGAITISVLWKDAKLAADIANQYVASMAQMLNEKAINVTVQVVDRAVPADRKDRPKTGLIAALAAVTSLFCGLLAAFALEIRKRHHS